MINKSCSILNLFHTNTFTISILIKSTYAHMEVHPFSYYIMYKLIIYLHVGGGVKNDVAQFSHPSFIRLSDIGQYCCFWNIYELTGQFFNMSKGPMWVPYCYNLLQIDLFYMFLFWYTFCLHSVPFT